MSHAQLRAKERYGLDLTWADLDRICASIKRGENAMLMRRGGRETGAEVWAVKVQGMWTQVVYVPEKNIIATFLPPAARTTRRAG